MKAVNSNLKTLKSDMVAVSAEFDDNANSVEALTAKQKVLQDTVEQQRVKVEALRAMYEKVKDTYGENCAQADKYKQQLNYATVELSKQTAALKKNEDALKKAENAADDTGDDINKMGNAAQDAASDLNKMEDAAQDAQGSVSKLGSIAGGVEKGVGAITAVGVAAGAALAAAGVAAITMLSEQAREMVEAAKAAQESGEILTPTQQAWLDFAGNLDTLDAAVQNAKGSLLGTMLPMLNDFSTEGAAFLNNFTRDMEAAAGDVGRQSQVLSEYITQGAQRMKEKLPEYIAVGKELLAGLGSGLAEAGPELLDIGMDLVMDLLDGIIANAPMIADGAMMLVSSLVGGFAQRGPDILAAAVQIVTNLVTGLATAAPQMIPAAAQLIMQLITTLAEAAPDLILAGLELVLGIITGMGNALPDVGDAVWELIRTIITGFVDHADDFLDVGWNIVRGIWNGISNGTEWIFGKIAGWVDNIVQWIKDLLDINSPSGVTEDEIGYFAGMGVGTGFVKSMPQVQSLIAKALNNLRDTTFDTAFDVPEFALNGPATYRGRNYTTSTGKVINIYFTAKTITEAEINMVVDIVNRKLGDKL